MARRNMIGSNRKRRSKRCRFFRVRARSTLWLEECSPCMPAWRRSDARLCQYQLLLFSIGIVVRNHSLASACVFATDSSLVSGSWVHPIFSYLFNIVRQAQHRRKSAVLLPRIDPANCVGGESVCQQLGCRYELPKRNHTRPGFGI